MSVEVLFVGGTGRSGSTIVANALGGEASLVSVGELRFLWQRGVIEDRLCGCGQPFSACPFWCDVMKRAYGTSAPDAQAVHQLLTRLTRLRHLPAYRSADARERLAAASHAERAAAVLIPLYEAVAEVSQARVVVDSSKLPTYAMLLDGINGVDVRVAHLVRDPRAAAFSWQRKKEQPDRRRPGHMEQRGSVKSAALWTLWNAALEQAWRGRDDSYRRLAYERIVAAPATELATIASMVGAGGLAERFLDEHTVLIEPSHTVAGNPARLSSGPTRLTLDDEWASAMPRRDQRTVVAIAGPLMRHYDYDTALTTLAARK